LCPHILRKLNDELFPKIVEEHTLQKNTSLVTNFSGQKLLVTIVTIFNTNSQSKKLLVIKIVTIINKKI